MAKHVFVRDATGLVKEIGILDAAWMNFLTVSPFVASIFGFALAPLVFPGGDLVVASIIATLGTLALAATYGFATAVMPRSGGDYVFVSRVIHPVIGFFTNLNWIYWIFGFWGFNAFLTALFFGRVMGDAGLSDFSAWVGTPTGTLIIASLFSLLGAILNIPRLRTLLKFQTLVGIITMIGSVAGIAVFAMGIGSFHQAFNQWAIANHAVNGTDPYQTVIQTAASQGFHDPGFTWAATLGVVVIMWGSINGSWLSSWMSGEMKSAQNTKRQMTVMVGATLVAGIILILLAATLTNAIGYTFFESLVYSSSSFPGTATSYDFFLRVLTQYMPFFDLVFFLGAFMWVVLDVLLTTRCIFAWSFDRLIPMKLATVSDRFHSPVVAIIVAFLGAEAIISLLTAFSGAVALYATATFGTIVTWFIAAIAVAIFPYVRRKQFEASIVNYRIGGLPAMTLVGILSIVYLSLMSYYVMTVPGLSGFSAITLESLVGLLIFASAVYLVSRQYHLRKDGIDISLAFQEIPPE